MHLVPSNGANMPALGFGTYRMPESEVHAILPKALALGFRHIDTAQVYENEAAVGAAIRVSGVPREEIFLTTKVWVDRFRRDDLVASVEESLRKLQTDHVDLLLLHWPKSDVPLAERIGALNEVARAGKTRHIGISNFNTARMAEAVALSGLPLATNQVEYHPYLDQQTLIEAARGHGLSVTAYYIMADGLVPKDQLLREIGTTHGKSAAQVALRWVVQQEGLVALSKTSTEKRLKENFDIFDFALTDHEMQAIHALAKPGGRIVDPAGLAETWDV